MYTGSKGSAMSTSLLLDIMENESIPPPAGLHSGCTDATVKLIDEEVLRLSCNTLCQLLKVNSQKIDPSIALKHPIIPLHAWFKTNFSLFCRIMLDTYIGMPLDMISFTLLQNVPAFSQ